MGQGVGPCLPKDLGRLGTASPVHLACRVIRRPDLARVPGAEDRGVFSQAPLAVFITEIFGF